MSNVKTAPKPTKAGPKTPKVPNTAATVPAPVAVPVVVAAEPVPAVEQAAQAAVAVDPAAEPAVAEESAAGPAQLLDDVLPDLVIDGDGKATICMLVALSGPDIDVVPKKAHRCSPREATRFIRRGMAHQQPEWLAAQPRG